MANRVYGYQGYSGYQFETSPKKLQPEYEPEKHEHKVKTDKKVKTQIKNPKVSQNKVVKEDFNKKVKFICYILFGFTVLFTISYRNSIINEKFNEKESLKAELAGIQKTNEQLEVSVENELNLTTVEQLAKSKLGMSKLNNSQKIYVSLEKKEYVESKSENNLINEEKNMYEKLTNKVKELFN